VRRPLRIAATFHHPYYAPLHVAHRLGSFAAAGLEPQISFAAEAAEAQRSLLRGEADLAVGGAIHAFVMADTAPPSRLLSIAEVNSRDGFFLLASRERAADFRWSELAGARLILFAEAPTPWLCLQDLLRRQGVDPSTVKVRAGLPVPAAVEAFLAGEADYLETGQPAAEALLERGAARLAAEVGAHVGHITYTSFVVTPETRDARPELCHAAVTALARALRFMATHNAEAITDLIAGDFPSIPRPRLARIVGRYQRLGSWPARPLVAREGIERLGRILADGGLIRHAASFEAIADNTFAEAALRDLGPEPAGDPPAATRP